MAFLLLDEVASGGVVVAEKTVLAARGEVTAKGMEGNTGHEPFVALHVEWRKSVGEREREIR